MWFVLHSKSEQQSKEDDDWQIVTKFPPHSWFSPAPGCDKLQYICTGSYRQKVQNTELGLGIHMGNESIQLCDGKL